MALGVSAVIRHRDAAWLRPFPHVDGRRLVRHARRVALGRTRNSAARSRPLTLSNVKSKRTGDLPVLFFLHRPQVSREKNLITRDTPPANSCSGAIKLRIR